MGCEVVWVGVGLCTCASFAQAPCKDCTKARGKSRPRPCTDRDFVHFVWWPSLATAGMEVGKRRKWQEKEESRKRKKKEEEELNGRERRPAERKRKLKEREQEKSKLNAASLPLFLTLNHTLLFLDSVCPTEKEIKVLSL